MADNSHPIVHIEIASKDARRSGEFYKNVFGWKIEVDPNFDYVQFQPGSGPAGGIPGVDGNIYKPGDVLVYIGTDDIESTLARIEQAGGKTVLPKTEIPGIGWWAAFTDPGGARMGLFTRKPM